MVKFINTPFDDIIKATENLYGGINCKVVFTYIDGKGDCGLTTFPDDGDPLISIDVTHNNIGNACATLVHELAHLIVGIEQEHNETFENCCKAIEEEYDRYCAEERYKQVCK